jgi:hypothetical protein
MRTLWFVCRCASLVVLALLAGCGGPGTVTGQVSYQGRPLPGGKVIFRPDAADKDTVIVDLDENGRFNAVVPSGRSRVAVDNRELEPIAAARPETPPGLKLPAPPPSKDHAPPSTATTTPQKVHGKYVKIPDQYYDVATSELEIVVKPGTQDFPIDLK